MIRNIIAILFVLFASAAACTSSSLPETKLYSCSYQGEFSSCHVYVAWSMMGGVKTHLLQEELFRRKSLEKEDQKRRQWLEDLNFRAIDELWKQFRYMNHCVGRIFSVETGRRLEDLVEKYRTYHEGQERNCESYARRCLDFYGKDCTFSKEAGMYLERRNSSLVDLLWKIVNFRGEILPYTFCADEMCYYSSLRITLLNKMEMLLEGLNKRPEDIDITIDQLVQTKKNSYLEAWKQANQKVSFSEVWKVEEWRLTQQDIRWTICDRFIQEASSFLTEKQIEQLHCENIDD
ncbi:MAG: hypothetical protein PHQ18_01175 [Patescibacteria group bacterium]|nr:hypothetical protein [Patescibacteria group bacterium]